MTHGSLFSGIGGFDLAAEWMGWENIFHCEWNPFCQRGLKYYWTKAISYNDITKTDFTIHRGTIDVLSGGFPCQPYSLAGKRKGKDDDRHLWPEMLRAIREIAPTFVVGENVSGLVNWNGGLVFDEVQADLENEGYEVAPILLPACGKNAPHRRERIWFVAYSRQLAERGKNKSKWASNDIARCREWEKQGIGIDEIKDGTFADTNSNGHQLRGSGENRQTEEESIGKQKERQRVWSDVGGIMHPGSFTDTASVGLQRRLEQREKWEMEKQFRRFNADKFRTTWQNFPTQSPICGGDDGLPTELDGITFPKWRNESIKAYGNAVVPEIPYQIFKAIEIYLNNEEI